MEVRDIECARDGGTITFTLADADALTGGYRLQTPWRGEPRPLFHDERRLPRGGAEERQLLAQLRAWLETALTDDLAVALGRLDAMAEWRNLPDELLAAVPLHRLLTVVRSLESRPVVALAAASVIRILLGVVIGIGIAAALLGAAMQHPAVAMLVMTGGAGGLLLWVAGRGLRRGHIAARRSRYLRKEQPAGFWFYVVFYALLGALLVGYGVWCCIDPRALASR
jgi:hypothetical protein